MNQNEQLAEFASNLWSNYIENKVADKLSGVISFMKALVISNNYDGTLTVQRPFDNPIVVNTSYGVKDINIGSYVIVMIFGGGNSKNYLAVSRANGDNIGLPDNEYMTDEEINTLASILGVSSGGDSGTGGGNR